MTLNYRAFAPTKPSRGLVLELFALWITLPGWRRRSNCSIKGTKSRNKVSLRGKSAKKYYRLEEPPG